MLVLLLIATLLAGAANAIAAPSQAERLPGRAFPGWLATADHTVFNELYLWSLEAGATVTLTCRPRPCGVPARGVRVPDSGIVDLRKAVQGRKHKPGSTLALRVSFSSGAVKAFTYRVKRRAAPVATRSCALPGQPAGSCVAPCPPPTGEPSDYCQGADQPLAPTSSFVGSVQRPTSLGPRGYRFPPRLRVTDVPAGSTIGVLCISTGKTIPCPFGARVFYAAQGGDIDVSRGLRHRWLPAGTVIEVRLFKASYIGHVLRLTVRRKDWPRLSVRCIYPTESEPRGCPG